MYTKIVVGNLAFYIRDSILKVYTNLFEYPRGSNASNFTLTAVSDFVLDIDANIVIKCKPLLEDIFDSYMRGFEE